MIRKLTTLIALGLCLYLIVSLGKDLYGIHLRQKEAGATKQKLEKLQTAQEDLKKRLEYVQTPDFVEEEARNKLGMSKPGESIAILPENIDKVMGIKEEEKSPEIPNWKKWGQIFWIFK